MNVCALDSEMFVFIDESGLEVLIKYFSNNVLPFNSNMLTLKQFIVYFVARTKGFLEIMDAASLGKEQWLKNSCRTGVHV